MAERQHDKSKDRLKAGIGVVALHALLGYAFISGLGVEMVNAVSDKLKIFDVPPPVPPPPIEEPIPAEARTPEEEGAAAPPSLKAAPSPVVAPPPRVKLEIPPPVRTAPEAFPVPPGNDDNAGSSTVDGPGTGAGGQGNGTGSGSGGSGTGGGGGGSRAERLSGGINGARDYPPAARRAGVEGTVVARFTVGPDGRARHCEVVRSSANAEIDATTCRLIERRFRYRPAQNAGGNPVAEVVTRTFDWTLPGRSSFAGP